MAIRRVPTSIALSPLMTSTLGCGLPCKRPDMKRSVTNTFYAVGLCPMAMIRPFMQSRKMPGHPARDSGNAETAQIQQCRHRGRRHATRSIGVYPTCALPQRTNLPQGSAGARCKLAPISRLGERRVCKPYKLTLPSQKRGP